MTRTKQIVCKSTGGKLPCTHLATGMTPPPFIPENPLACRSYSRNFHEIGGQGGEEQRNNMARTAPAVFHAHQGMLQQSSVTLAERAVWIRRGQGGRFWSKSGCITEYLYNLLNYIKCIKPDDDMMANTKEISHQSETEGRCLHCKSNTEYLANIGSPSLRRV